MLLNTHKKYSQIGRKIDDFGYIFYVYILKPKNHGFGGHLGLDFRGLRGVLAESWGRLGASWALQDAPGPPKDSNLGPTWAPRGGPRGVPDRENIDQNPSLGASKLGSPPGGTPEKEKY